MHMRTLLQCTLLLSMILLATACAPKAPEAAPSAAAPAASTSVAAASPVASSGAAAAPAAASTVATAATQPAAATADAPAGAAPVEGSDYMPIDTPDQPSGDKVQVTEVFGYGCPHCSVVQPSLAAWEKKLPADVNFSYLPAAFGSDPNHCWDDFARAFYAAQAMGVQEKSHDSIYKAVFDAHRFNGCASIPALYADYGVDPKVFSSTMQSFAVSAKIAAARDQAMRWGVDSTPTIIVDGKYRVPGKPDTMFHTIDWLIAKQRPEHAKH